MKLINKTTEYDFKEIKKGLDRIGIKYGWDNFPKHLKRKGEK